MEKKGTLTRGPIEIQYAHHLKQMAKLRKEERSANTAAQTVRMLREKQAKEKTGGEKKSTFPDGEGEEEDNEKEREERM